MCSCHRLVLPFTRQSKRHPKMKHLVLLVLICSMTGLPVNAIDSPTTVRLFVSSDEDTTLMQAYLKRELRKLEVCDKVSDFYCPL